MTGGTDEPPTVAVLAGGVGAARLLRAMLRVVPGDRVTAVVNTADDTVLHGLHVSPDIDTVVYTCAGAIDPDRGWGLVGETWHALGALERYARVRPDGSTAATTWFGLGDRDLATHLYRTARLSEGATLTEVTAEITAAWELDLRGPPATDQVIRTRIDTIEHGTVEFQEFFVRLRHAVPVAGVRFDHDGARPTDAVRRALTDADVVVIAPSNPLVSIGPIRALTGIDDLLAARRASVVAVSPIVGGAALKGPADRMLVELGHRASADGVAELYRDIAGTIVIDAVDADTAARIEALGLRAVVTDTVMSDPEVAANLATTVIRAGAATP
ncbi:MAG: 2-phospho-L-lactate transferase [Ilumatobacteraceae bacterium]